MEAHTKKYIITLQITPLQVKQVENVFFLSLSSYSRWFMSTSYMFCCYFSSPDEWFSLMTFLNPNLDFILWCKRAGSRKTFSHLIQKKYTQNFWRRREGKEAYKWKWVKRTCYVYCFGETNYRQREKSEIPIKTFITFKYFTINYSRVQGMLLNSNAIIL